ncbi:MAG: polynucleotide adenylyltransferase [Tistrella sp.]|uniref:CCA tRNA nucleotidyltransferase n=1 Tax=Tistrella mobilis TaxID=171437 RepID=A0A3B9ILQ3_9PROT|nr:CCA tRNA nucleotidyltransferase [Tistrella sp.]MAD40700.1 polynucleotide adenylyltransferase [Tistrella sp.]MBA78826.1 polynucleotide adenylyltransferase [Tistrella sp.]HAE48792.1 CCA tRNA nucleotidyltransferase [Tistrella mobilis]
MADAPEPLLPARTDPVRTDVVLPPEMAAAPVRRVFAALAAAGGEARFVGGAVRDLISGDPIGDIDVATTLEPPAVMAAAAAAGIKAVPTGIEHGTVTLIADRFPVEVTTLRRDVATDGRRAVVAFSRDWAEDARRRDFTVNAMSLDLAGRLYDPFDGLSDLAAGRVRFIGDARRRILEDILRILRFFRFQARLGRGEPDRAAVDACREFAERIQALSGERIREEFLRILGGPRVAGGDGILLLMADLGVLDQVLGGIVDTGPLDALIAIEEALDMADAARRLAVLTATCGPAFGAVDHWRRRIERLKPSNQLAARVGAVAEATARLPARPPSPMTVRVAAYREGITTIRDRLFAGWARAQARGTLAADDEAGFRSAIGALSGWSQPHLPLGGADLIALGLKPGPGLGQALSEIEAWWLDEGFVPDRGACLAEARRRFVPIGTSAGGGSSTGGGGR